MNFFEHQHRARQNTKQLVVLFILAVAGIIAAITALVCVVWLFNDREAARFVSDDQNVLPFFLQVGAKVAPLTILVIGFVSWIRISHLGGNGKNLAIFLGAEPLTQATELKDKQLQNIVEEMAIASGIPVPPVYVLRREQGINAFAAGSEPSGAVIGVTQGTLDKLNRDELQGVVAHEFSHILNGDMRLNINLIGVLAGIMFVTSIGRFLVEVSSRPRRSLSRKNDGGAAFVLIGVGLLVIGAIGTFFASWIKEAVSREREYLADASAVQFTRNPLGISGALMKIRDGGSSVRAARAEEASHMFFGAIKSFMIFGSHPPIEERIRRIGAIPKQEIESPIRYAQAQPKNETVKTAVGRVGNPRAEDFVKAVTVIQGISEETRDNLRKPKAAVEIVLGVLARDSGNEETMAKLDPFIQKTVKEVPADRVLTLVDLALPALKQLEPSYAQKFLTAVEVMIHGDEKVQPLEIAVLSMLRRQFAPKGREKSVTLTAAKSEAIEVLKIVARAGHTTEALARAAFAAGASKIGSDAAVEWPKSPGPAEAIVTALVKLSGLVPNDKGRFFEALWTTANHDKNVTLAESLYLRAISEALEIPLPVTA